MLTKWFTILGNLLNKDINAYERLWMPLRILRMCCEWKANAKQGYLFCIIRIAGVSFCHISARPCPISLFSFKILIFHIRPAFCGNVNTKAGESLQTSYDRLQTSYDPLQMSCHQQKWLTTAHEYVAFLTNIRRMFLIFARPQKCLRTPQ